MHYMMLKGFTDAWGYFASFHWRTIHMRVKIRGETTDVAPKEQT